MDLQCDFWKFQDEKKNLKIKTQRGTITNGHLKAATFVPTNASVLDIGAGEKAFLNALKSLSFQGSYKSMDVDQNRSHDYSNIEEIEGPFDVISLFEVIEHMDLNSFYAYMTNVYNLLKPGGKLILSTPNINHINQLWKSNIFHVQQYPVPDTCALLKLIGFKGEIHAFRISLPEKKLIRKFFLNPYKKIICYALGVDHAEGILLIINKC